MRTTRWTIALLAVATCGGLGWMLRERAPREEPRPLTAKEAIGLEEDALARIRWEHERLRDPATGKIPDGMRARELAFAAALPERSTLPRGLSAEPALVDWQFRGPVNVGGRTRALAFDVSDPTSRTLLAGGISGGMWRTTDDGASWTLTTGSDDFIGVTSVAQDTRAGRQLVWYYGTGEYIGASASEAGAAFAGHGIFKSTDGGRSWAQLPSTATGSSTGFDNPFDYVFRVVTDPSNATQDEVYAACYGGIQRSTDGGQTWNLVKGSLQNGQAAFFSDVIITPSGVLYAVLDSAAGNNKGIWRSTNGTTWVNILPAGFPPTYDRMVLGYAPSDPNQIWVIGSGTLTTSNNSLWKYTYLSGDGSGAGGSWVDRSTQLNNLPIGAHNQNRNFNSQGGYDLVVAVKPDDPNFVVIGGVDLIRSTDGFASAPSRTWIGGWLYPDPNQEETHHADQHVFLFHPTNPNVAYSGSDGGVRKAPDIRAPVIQWQSLNNGYQTSQFYTMAVDHAAASGVLIGGLQDNGTFWTNGGPQVPWIQQFGGDGAYCAVTDRASVDGGYYYVSAQGNVVYRFELSAQGVFDNSTWTRVDPAAVQDNQYFFINPFILDPADTKRMYAATRAGVWRNSNLEQVPAQSNEKATVNWTQLTSVGAVSALAASTQPAGTLYYGTADGKVLKVANAPTAPANTTPTDLTPAGVFPASGYVSTIAVDPGDANRILVGFSNYGVASLFFTSNGGANWSSVEGNLAGVDGPSIRSVAILGTDQGPIFLAGTSTGLYTTSTLAGGSTVWTREAPEKLGTLVVDRVVARQLDGQVVAATHGGGVFSAVLSGGGSACATLEGDANEDAIVNVVDVTAVVDDILEATPLPEQVLPCVDLAGGAGLDVRDVVKIVRIILGLPARWVGEELAGDLRWRVESRTDHVRLALGPGDVAALQCEVRLPEGATLDGPPRLVASGRALELDWSVDAGGRVRVVAFSADLATAAEARGTEFEIRFTPSRSGAVATVDGLLALDANGRSWRLQADPFRAPAARIVSIAPNPTSGDATIDFELKSGSPARLEIFDVNGRRVRTLVDGWQVAGLERARWDGRGEGGSVLASGTYFARLTTPQGESRASILLLR